MSDPIFANGQCDLTPSQAVDGSPVLSVYAVPRATLDVGEARELVVAVERWLAETGAR